MNALRRMLSAMGGGLLAAVDEAKGRGVEVEFEPVREARQKAPVISIESLKVNYKQTRKRVTHWALKAGMWRVGEVMTLQHSGRKYRVQKDGSWRRLMPFYSNGKMFHAEGRNSMLRAA